MNRSTGLHFTCLIILFSLFTACAPAGATAAPLAVTVIPPAAQPAASPIPTNSGSGITWYPTLDAKALAANPAIEFIPNLTGYQQTTEFTCGPAALLSVALFYKLPGFKADKDNEMRITSEVGTRERATMKPGEKPGTKPEEMVKWLEKNGFKAELSFESKGDYSSLEKIRQNIRQGIPTIVEWIDLSGHWVVAVGYDDRGTPKVEDDVIIFADPYDRYDDHPDGYTFFNADAFYWMWFDALYFDKVTWRTMITVTRK